MTNSKTRHTRAAKTIATHALLVALFTQPWLVALVSDLAAIATGSTELSLAEIMRNGLSVISTVTLSIAALAAAWYFFANKRKATTDPK